ncbi:MAG TPA: type I glutamate--ammonia ligase [Actinomycetota bacterium]|nr:type I glutamate--ammonia ligase [Actinomycetota bacterium]
MEVGRVAAGERGAPFVLQAAEEHRIRFVRLWFTDVLGYLKSFAIPAEELPEALAEGVSFDGSSIDGFARVQEADMVARPDPTTFELLPWAPEDRRVARMFCDIYTPDGEPFAGDPRFVLRRALARAADLGFSFYVGPEIEFFLFKDAKTPEPLDEGSYFDLTPLDVGSDFRRRVITYLEALGIPVKDSHHEVAASQHEVDLRHADALTIADSVMTFRLVVKEVAQELGVYATFMPKPIQGAWGSGLHLHLSLFEGERNAFFDPTDEHYLSKTARSFMAGLLRHAREITAVTNQWVNSYKRLVPGFEAPVYVCWGIRNRSALVRVPLTKPGKESACRIEYRAPDPACNPYLAFAVILGAGLRGVENEYPLPLEASDDIYRMTDIERWGAGIEQLPESLPEAIAAMRGSGLVREVLGEHVFDWFLANKVAEWDEYKAYVTAFELQRYLPRL